VSLALIRRYEHRWCGRSVVSLHFKLTFDVGSWQILLKNSKTEPLEKSLRSWSQRPNVGAAAFERDSPEWAVDARAHKGKLPCAWFDCMLRGLASG